MIDLTDKVAVVTGAAGGLGRAIVNHLASAGARISAWDRQHFALTPSGLEGNAKGHLAIAVDIRQYEDVEMAARQTIDSCGQIDILVNNASILGPVVETWHCDTDAWSSVVETNLNGTFHCIRAVIPLMLPRGAGRIVNVASVQAKEGTARSGPYSASKAGVIALTKVVGRELARSGITVNCITPTVVETGMFDQIDERRRTELLKLIPMGRFAQASEIATMVGWICSPECSFTTGAVFDVSGGRSSY